jgi:hypothetical protein
LLVGRRLRVYYGEDLGEERAGKVVGTATSFGASTKHLIEFDDGGGTEAVLLLKRGNRGRPFLLLDELAGRGRKVAGTADVQSLVECVKVKKRNRRGRAQTRTLYLDGTTVWVGKSRARATKFFPLLHLDVADSRGSSEVAGGWLRLRRTTGEALDLHVAVLPDARFPSSATLHALLDAQRSLYARKMEERDELCLLRKELEETRLLLLHEGGGGEAADTDGEWDQQEQEFDHLLSMSLMSGGGGLQARLEQKNERLNWRWSTFRFRIQGTELTRKGNDGNVNARYTITGACRHCRPLPPLPSLPPLPPLPRLIAATAVIASDTSPVACLVCGARRRGDGGGATGQARQPLELQRGPGGRSE